MKRETVLKVLKMNKQELQERYGVTRLGIFGSLARDEAVDSSDVDVVVEMPPDLFSMVHVKEELEMAFQMPVDLIRYQKRMNHLLKKHIDREAVYV